VCGENQFKRPWESALGINFNHVEILMKLRIKHTPRGKKTCQAFLNMTYDIESRVFREKNARFSKIKNDEEWSMEKMQKKMANFGNFRKISPVQTKFEPLKGILKCHKF
jgi:hypothetical protein